VEPDASLTEQYQALLATEGVALTFTDDGLDRIAELACQVNENTENIGARRLHTVMEVLLEQLSFDASERAERQVVIDRVDVERTLQPLLASQDLARFIL
jgi:ATP-dependent HslUV protease ATP-binding subunit HslU